MFDVEDVDVPTSDVIVLVVVVNVSEVNVPNIVVVTVNQAIKLTEPMTVVKMVVVTTKGERHYFLIAINGFLDRMRENLETLDEQTVVTSL